MKRFQEDINKPEVKFDAGISFNNLKFDSNGKMLLLSHESAGFYYKINFLFLSLWMFFTYQSYKENKAFLFSNELITKAYIGSIWFGLIMMFLISNRHIRYIYLNSNGTDVTIVLHKGFSLWYSEKVIDMHLFQLSYDYKSLTNKLKSNYMIFRPQFVHDKDLWKLVRTGNYIRTEEFIQKESLK